MFLWRDVAQHRRAEPADHRGADARCYMIVAGGDVCGERAERVERCLVAFLQLFIHVDLDEVHRHVAGAFDHDLAVVLPRLFREFAQRFKFSELRAVVGIGD